MDLVQPVQEGGDSAGIAPRVSQAQLLAEQVAKACHLDPSNRTKIKFMVSFSNNQYNLIPVWELNIITSIRTELFNGTNTVPVD